MSKWYIRPEEIIAEIRKRYPTERIFASRPHVPGITVTNEYLYGVPLYVYGEGIKGQYLKHGYFDRDGKRYWAIEYGWTSLYGVLRENEMPIPLVVLGLPTRLVFEYKPADFERFKLEEVPLGYFECLERQMVNIDRVMRGEDPILVIDKYDLLRESVPSEFISRIMEQQTIIETLQKTIWQYEKAINDYKTNISVLQSRNAKLTQLLRDYEERLIRLNVEVTSVQQELIRLREEIFVRGAEAEALEETRRRLRNIIDKLIDVFKEVPEVKLEKPEREEVEKK